MSGVKRALLVGIDDYKKEKCKLEGCINDIKLIEALLSKFDFAASNIYILADKKATRKNILKALDNAISATEPQDVFLFYFSGHGSEKANKSKPNGYNETIVPYDGRRSRQSAQDITDDEIRDKLKQFRSRNIALVFDSCHSGDITRNPERAASRGADSKCVRGIPPPDDDYNEIIQTCADRQQSYRGAPVGTDSGWLPRDNYVVLAACKDRQEAHEKFFKKRNNKHGYLTHYLCRVLEKLDSDACENTTWMAVFEALMVRFKRWRMLRLRQEPTLEGCRDWQLFGTAPIIPDRHVVARLDKDKTVVLNAGFLHGIGVDSEWKLFKNTVKEYVPRKGMSTWRPVANQMYATTTVLECISEEAVDLNNYNIYHAICTRNLFKRGARFFVSRSEGAIDESKRDLRDIFKSRKSFEKNQIKSFVTETNDLNDADYQITMSETELQVQDKRQTTMASFTTSFRETELFANNISKLAWSHGVKTSLTQLPCATGGLDGEFRWHLIKVAGERKNVIADTEITNTSQITMKEDDEFFFVVENLTTSTLFVALIEYTMGWGVNIAYPPFGVDGKLTAGGKLEIPAVKEEPYGHSIPAAAIADNEGRYHETVQLIVTTCSTDFSWMWQQGIRLYEDVVKNSDVVENARGDEVERDIIQGKKKRAVDDMAMNTPQNVRYAIKTVDLVIEPLVKKGEKVGAKSVAANERLSTIS